MFSKLYDMITLSNFLLLGVFFLLGVAYRVGFKKIRIALLIWVTIFLVVTTQFVPTKLVAAYEAKVIVCNPKLLDTTKTYYLHVLGAGYCLDPRLPATGQLSAATLTRLVEAIRISKSLPHYKIVTSAYSSLGLEPQASVVRRAAIELGIPSQNIEMLTTPSNTSEEVAAFIKQFGTHQNVIVVSDAMHLPRALMLYQKGGITARAAPSNFKVKQGPIKNSRFNFPTLSSLNLMNEYLRERLKYWKDGRGGELKVKSEK